jgi:hypothetical protein
MLGRRGRGLRLAMEHRMIMTRVTLSRETRGQPQRGNSNSTNHGVRMRHKELYAIQLHLILG